MKAIKIMFWVSTVLIFLFEGVMPAFTSQTEMAKEGIRHLGYPAYFGMWLAVFKVCGALVLIIPTLSIRLKEWAYAGFTFNLFFAFLSHTYVDGFGGMAVFPLIVLSVLAVSYFSLHRIVNASVTINKNVK